jgi:isoleucyl-tRNA synthetase
MEAYNLTKATRPLTEFVDQLSNWYIRRSRRRFWKSESDSDKQEAYQTLYLVLTTFCKVIAPFTPFIADAIYKNLTKLDSVHFADWPEVDKKRLNADLNEVTNTIREIVSLGHTIRGQQKIKVRQPLALVEVAIADAKLKAKISNQTEVILEELNIKELNLATDLGDKVKPVLKINAKLIGPKFGKEVQTIINEAKAGNFQILESGQAQILDFLIEPEEFELAFEAKPGLAAAAKDGIVVILHTEISEELKYEGFARDIVRQIQDLRKEADYQVSDRITVLLKTDNPELETAILNFADYIKTETLATELQQSGDMDYDKSTTTKLEGIEIQIAIRKS